MDSAFIIDFGFFVLTFFALTAYNDEKVCHRDDYAYEITENGVHNISDYLDFVDRTGISITIEEENLSWQFQTNLTKENSLPLSTCSGETQLWYAKQKNRVQRLKVTNLTEDQRRLLEIINDTITSSDNVSTNAISSNMSEIEQIYATAQVVLDNGTRLTPGESGIEDFFQHERDYDKLSKVWKQWRDLTGKKIRPYYVKLIKLQNKRAKENGFSDKGILEWWTDFKDPKFNEKVVDLYEEVKPLYKELHAFVRHKLCIKYPGKFSCSGPVPAHLFGNIWVQDWTEIFDILMPNSNIGNQVITKSLLEQKWTVNKIVKKTEEFFTSLGFDKMTKTFWQKSIFENPGDRPFNCHASAYDMGNGDDYRIKMCGSVAYANVLVIHHEMGHLAYAMSYKHLPYLFRAGANAGFHEAIGDTIALSVNTVSHLRKIGILPETTSSKELDTNILLTTALKKVAFLPFGLLMDTWAWRVYNGSVTENEYNKEWWRLKLELQGIIPPVTRSETDLDPAAKYHIAHGYSYIRYFVSNLLQFQFYQAMCEKSGHKGPLHQCDFYQSKAAGDLFKSMLSLGASRPWPEALEKMTGQRQMLTSAILNYFSPLDKWLKTQRKNIGYPIGW